MSEDSRALGVAAAVAAVALSALAVVLADVVVALGCWR